MGSSFMALLGHFGSRVHEASTSWPNWSGGRGQPPHARLGWASHLSPYRWRASEHTAGGGVGGLVTPSVVGVME